MFEVIGGDTVGSNHTLADAGAVADDKENNFPAGAAVIEPSFECDDFPDVGVKIFGDSLDRIQRKAYEVEKLIKSIEGAAGVGKATSIGQYGSEPVMTAEPANSATASVPCVTASARSAARRRPSAAPPGVVGTTISIGALPEALPFWAAAAAAGGLIGTQLGTRHLPIPGLRYALAAVLFIAAGKLVLT